MRIAVTGASGLIGRALVSHLARRGHDVVRLVRRSPAAADEVHWDPDGGSLDVAALGSVDAVVHLAAAPASFPHRWTEARKSLILESRVQGTRALSTALAQMETPPRVLVSASAIGYYGGTGDTQVDEGGPRGAGFLADVVVQWEAAAEPARAAGIRVAHARTGLVVAGHGGAWGVMWPIFRLGVGGRLSSGKQWWSFISLRDEVRALQYLIEQPIAGPVNLVAPNPATNDQVTRAMGALLRRPTVLPVPRVALQIVLGEFASEVLDTPRVKPGVLLDAGFTFSDPTIEAALAWAWASR